MFRSLRIAHMLGEGGEKRRTPIIHRPRQLRLLARSKDAGMRFAVARSPYSNREVLELLVADESWPVRMAVACHPSLPLEFLERLLEDEESAVVQAAVLHPLFFSNCTYKWSLPSLRPQERRMLVAIESDPRKAAFRSLVTCEHWMTRVLAAHRAREPVDIIKLLDDKDECVRTALVHNIRLLYKDYEKLAADMSETVVLAVAGNPRTPLEIVERLYREHRSDDVRERALWNLRKRSPKYAAEDEAV